MKGYLFLLCCANFRAKVHSNRGVMSDARTPPKFCFAQSTTFRRWWICLPLQMLDGKKATKYDTYHLFMSRLNTFAEAGNCPCHVVSLQICLDHKSPFLAWKLETHHVGGSQMTFVNIIINFVIKLNRFVQELKRQQIWAINTQQLSIHSCTTY